MTIFSSADEANDFMRSEAFTESVASKLPARRRAERRSKRVLGREFRSYLRETDHAIGRVAHNLSVDIGRKRFQEWFKDQARAVEAGPESQCCHGWLES